MYLWKHQNQIFFYSYLYLLALLLKYNTNDMGKVSTYYDPSYQP